MTKEYIARVVVKLNIRANDDTEINDILNEMGYHFEHSQNGVGNIIGTEIIDWTYDEVKERM